MVDDRGTARSGAVVLPLVGGPAPSPRWARRWLARQHADGEYVVGAIECDFAGKGRGPRWTVCGGHSWMGHARAGAIRSPRALWTRIGCPHPRVQAGSTGVRRDPGVKTGHEEPGGGPSGEEQDREGNPTRSDGRVAHLCAVRHSQISGRGGMEVGRVSAAVVPPEREALVRLAHAAVALEAAVVAGVPRRAGERTGRGAGCATFLSESAVVAAGGFSEVVVAQLGDGPPAQPENLRPLVGGLLVLLLHGGSLTDLPNRRSHFAVRSRPCQVRSATDGPCPERAGCVSPTPVVSPVGFTFTSRAGAGCRTRRSAGWTRSG